MKTRIIKKYHLKKEVKEKIKFYSLILFTIIAELAILSLKK